MKLGRGVAVLVALACVATSGLLWATAQHPSDAHHDDWWALALPTYLTGVGTLALAALNVILLRQQAQDVKASVNRERQAENAAVLRDARNVIAFFESERSGDGGASVTILNATRSPIIDLRCTFWSGGFLQDRDARTGEFRHLNQSEQRSLDREPPARRKIRTTPRLITADRKELVKAEDFWHVSCLDQYVQEKTGPEHLSTVLRWRDSHGNTWQRVDTFEPTQIAWNEPTFAIHHGFDEYPGPKPEWL